MKNYAHNYPYYDVPKIHDLSQLVKLHRNSKRSAFKWQPRGGQLQHRSFQQTYHDITHLSAFFSQKHRQQHIAVIGENSYAWLIYSLAIILSGNVCVAIDKDGDLDTIKRQLKQCDVKALCYSEEYNPELGALFRSSYSFEELDELIATGRQFKNQYRVDPDAAAMIFFTSGTTGYGKAVVLTQRSIATDIYGAASIFQPDGGACSFLPYHHAFGYVTSALKPYYYGVTTFISSSFKHLVSDFQLAKPDTIFAVPMVVETIYKQIWREARRQNSDTSLKIGLKLSRGFSKLGIDLRKRLFKKIHAQLGGKLQYIICGGAALNVEYVKWFRAIGIEVLNGYGITECSPVVSVNRNHFHRDGSIGQLCRDVDVKIIDGEIAVKGDVVMKEYYKDKAATAASLRNGYYFTGDLGYLDEDGFLYITGRRKNLIILSNGENISPEEIERELVKEKAIAEVIIYEQNNRIFALVVPEEGYLGDQDYFDDIIYKYNQSRAKNRQIAAVRLRETAFPRNNNGKIVRRNLIEEN
ncbi:AMP-binding protein [Candidatus Saccharibacteria bacterium]|nr:AMP-binding protein [Candidatus Saccharibacteria bacterium]